jgi:hypothetical protein
VPWGFASFGPIQISWFSVGVTSSTSSMSLRPVKTSKVYSPSLDAYLDLQMLSYIKRPLVCYAANVFKDVGFSASVVGATNQSKVQLSISDGFHRRVIGWAMVGIYSRALGTMPQGVITDMTGLRQACSMVSIAGMLGVGAIVLIRPSSRR